ncbi:MAG: hypothetical protein Q7R41_06635 [Phycisphaerales bacterium]|nr:hypothetical protein [Phycisphaerales bacterium]
MADEWRRPSERIRLTAVAIILGGSAFAGCSTSRSNARADIEKLSARNGSSATVRPWSWEDEIVAWTTQTFDKVIYYKPRDGEMIGPERTYAPLIIEEFMPQRHDGRQRIGQIVKKQDSDDPRAYQLNTGASVIYTASSRVTISEVDCEQILYAWWYPIEQLSADEWYGCEAGVSITVGADGFPLVWESISNVGGRVLFVSKSLEDAARGKFGPPLPGRRFSIERAREETPKVVVAGVIEDGPVPMGPYVYLGLEAYPTITTILCRCSPSQFNEVSETVEYDLRPLNELGILHAPPLNPRVRSRFENIWGREVWLFLHPELRDPLDRILRWPKM